MNDWSPTATYRKIAEANRQYYARTAAVYDETETCLVGLGSQAELEHDLGRALDQIGKPAAQVRALDACGGSGNVALRLLKRGVQVTLADISPDLISIFRNKADAAQYAGQAVCSEIGAFLAEDGPVFDLIVFSSALHHLEDIHGVLTLAFRRLSSGGTLLTIFDPTLRERWGRLTRVAARIDYYWFKLSCQKADLLPALGRRLRRLASGASPEGKDQVALSCATAGMLAEYHVERGIDDLALAARLQKIGYQLLWHERCTRCRSRGLQNILSALGTPTTFKLLLRKP